MKTLVYPLLAALLLSGALLSSDTRAAAQPPEPQQPKPSEEPLETFVPSEKLPADSAISFPVDI
jgi:hypothetical protein